MINTATVSPAEQSVLDTLRATELEALTSYTLADAIRDGSGVTSQEYGWGAGENACALSAARLSARARGYIA